MKYGSRKYNSNTHWGETTSSFTADTSTTVSFSVDGGFGDGYFGLGFFGSGEHGAATITYTVQNPTMVVFT